MGLISDFKAINAMTAKTVKENFQVEAGMTTSQVLAKLDTPLNRKQKGKKDICKWKKQLNNGRSFTFKIIFVDDIAKEIK